MSKNTKDKPFDLSMFASGLDDTAAKTREGRKATFAYLNTKLDAEHQLGAFLEGDTGQPAMYYKQGTFLCDQEHGYDLVSMWGDEKKEPKRLPLVKEKFICGEGILFPEDDGDDNTEYAVLAVGKECVQIAIKGKFTYQALADLGCVFVGGGNCYELEASRN